MKRNKKNNNVQKQTPKAESLEDRVHRHLKDINSKITDDDIRNVKTELEIRLETNSDHTTGNGEEENKDEKK